MQEEERVPSGIPGLDSCIEGGFEKNSAVEMVNPDAPIATLTDAAANLEMTVIAQKGRGYIPVEARENEKLEVGFMALDAVYTPVRNVNFKTEHVRVEQMTNYDKLMLDVTTDGTVTPQEALSQASQILVDHFGLIKTATGEADATTPATSSEESDDLMSE
jgi:DNA-directed RNA polymerase subunit alpha